MDFTLSAPIASGGRRVLSALRGDVPVRVALVAIIAIALALRLYGLNWDSGFPHTPHPDERAILMKVAEISPPAPGNLGSLFDADESSWNPRWFPYGSFPLYLLKGVQLVYSIGPGELNDLRIAGRTLSALADVVTVFMVFALGSSLYRRRVGLLAAAFTALAVLHIQLSHYFAVDAFLALFAVVTLYFLYRVARHGRVRDSVLAGAVVGLGIATKVSFVPIYGAFVVAHLMYAFSALGGDGTGPSFAIRRSWAMKGLAAGAGVSVLVLFIDQPYTFLDWDRFYRDVVEQSEMVRRIRDYPYTRQYIDTTPYWYQVRQLATWGLGWPLGVIAWSGVVYASLRGMRLSHGLAYLVLGIGLPMAILLASNGIAAAAAASVVALLALLATLPFRSEETRGDVLLLSWVMPVLLITGSLQVKFLRYLIPVTPLLLLFGSRMLLAIWDRAQLTTLRFALRPWLLAGLVLVLGATAFYAVSYLSVYREPHTAVRAADWLRQNAPEGSIILKEHWEEGLPHLDGYQIRELEMYNDDRPQKFREVAESLAQADYLVLFSNRLYGTIPRLPERYPISTEYYRLLFSGELGYELVRFETSYPDLLGVGFVDETFRRPGVREPEPLRGVRPASLSLNLGFADESFSVYDHPKVLILENVRGYDADGIAEIIEGAASYTAIGSPEVDNVQGLMLSPEDAAIQQAGGTWTDIVTPASWMSRLPVLSWLIVVEGFAFLALPIAFYVFRPLGDRGYLFSKALGLLLVSLIVWLLASFHWLSFSHTSIVVAAVILFLVSALMVARNRREMIDFVRARWSLLLVAELVFLVAFLSFVMLRMANPDLWHPYRGGEKPMDFAYLNAVLRSTYMPPYDPWFAGGYLNYYYWGQFIVAMLVRATGVVPEVAFNIAVPLFFALTVAASYSIVYNLAEATRWPAGRGTDLAESGDSERGDTRARGRWSWPPALGRLRWSPILAGLGGALFVTVLGNLDGAVQVGHGVWRAVALNAPFGQFNFWASRDMMQPDPPGFEITEFPFFTFLFADLHAHLMALPFTLLVLGVALAVVMGFGQGRGHRWGLVPREVARLAVLGLAVGSLWVLNSWDFPTYLVIAVAAVFLAEFFAHGGVGLTVFARTALKGLFVFGVGFVAFLPFHLSNEAFFNSLERTTNDTALWQFLAIGGLFVFIIGSFAIRESRDLIAGVLRGGGRWRIGLVSVDSGRRGAPSEVRVHVSVVSVAIAVLGVLAAAAILAAITTGHLGSTIPFVAALMALVAVAAVGWLASNRADAPQLGYMAALVGVALALVIGLDVFRVEGDVDRMNSVFKFYLQAWVLLSLASAYILWRMAQRWRWAGSGVGAKVWLGVLVLLIASAAVYPVLGTQDRLRDRFDGQETPLTLNGTAFLEGAVFRDIDANIKLGEDLKGIRWLRSNVEGSPVVLEGMTPSYRWGGRISSYTGLPSVVGWQWHQEQQRWNYRESVGRRIEDVNTIYRTEDPSEALALMEKYGVAYVYVGELEKVYYPEEGLRKFDEAFDGRLERVFHSEPVSVYRVLDGAS